MSTTSFADLGRIVVIIPTFNERATLPVIVARVRDVGARGATSSSPTTTPRTAPAASPTSSPPRTTTSTSCTGSARRASAPPTSPGSPGRCRRATTSSSRWTPTARTSPSSCRGCSTPCAPPTSCSARAGCRGDAPRTGRRAASSSPGAAAPTRGSCSACRIQDATGGYRAFRADTLRKLDLHEVASQGYCFQIDLAWRAVQRGLTRARGAHHLRRAHRRAPAR